jgi:hypothetical protein
MKNKIYLLAIIGSLWFANLANAQVRQDLNTGFTTAEKDTLVTLMQQYIDNRTIEYHCDYTNQTNDPNLDIHSDFDFLPFHRVYMEGMEDYLILKGHPEFVPLPSWDPNTSTPNLFRVVDTDCQTTTCSNAPPASSGCNTNHIWNPQISLPNVLKLPVQSGINNDLCDWSFSPDTAGQNDPVGLSRIIEGSFFSNNYHNSVHVEMSNPSLPPIQRGVMGNFRSPSAPIFWNWHAFADDIWKEWECNCPSSNTQSVDLYMKDNQKVMEDWRDRGEEPSLDPNNLIYLSEDMWIQRDDSSGFSSDEHENAQFDTTLAGPSLAYVYVRVRNRGCDTSLGTEQLYLHWSKAFLAGVSWPTGWNGGTTNPGNVLMGDLVDSMSIPQIPPGGQTIMRYTWTVPDPDDYNSISTEPWHFCLAARVVASNDPMAVPEGPSIAANTVNNNNIIW